MTNVSVESRHLDVSDAMKDYAREKLDKLPRYYDGLQSIVLTFDKDAGDFLVEVVASGRRKAVFVATHRDADIVVSVDQCVHKITEQIRRHKDKVRDRHGPSHEETMQPKPPESQ